MVLKWLDNLNMVSILFYLLKNKTIKIKFYLLYPVFSVLRIACIHLYTAWILVSGMYICIYLQCLLGNCIDSNIKQIHNPFQQSTKLPENTSRQVKFYPLKWPSNLLPPLFGTPCSCLDTMMALWISLRCSNSSSKLWGESSPSYGRTDDLLARQTCAVFIRINRIFQFPAGCQDCLDCIVRTETIIMTLQVTSVPIFLFLLLPDILLKFSY